MKYQFIAEHRHEYPVTIMCRVLAVSVSGYSAWCKRPPRKPRREDAQLAARLSMQSSKPKGCTVLVSE